jgi:hypothetical protein
VLGLLQAEMLSALVQSANSQLRHFGPQELTNMVWALSQLFRSKAPFGPDTDVSAGVQGFSQSALCVWGGWGSARLRGAVTRAVCL